MIVVLLASSFAFHGNSLTDNLRRDLLECGFDNVSVVLRDGHIVIAYEDRVCRDEIRAVRKILAIASAATEEYTEITLIPQNRGVPLAIITVSVDEHSSSLNAKASDRESGSAIDVSLDVDQAWWETQRARRANLHSHRFDLVIHPQFKAIFGDYSNPVKAQINLAPEINTTLWKGMSLSAQLIVSLYDEIGEEGDIWRPGLLTINQIARLPGNVFVSTTAGYFTRDRYGTDLEIRKYFVDGGWSVGANLGYTGHASYLKGTWYYSNVNLLTASFDTEYWFPQFDLALRATYGTFLYRDKGWRFDVFRYFNTIGIGFFGLRTGRGSNAGFGLRIPISPSGHLSIGRIRTRLARELLWEYRHKGLPKNGIQYNTGSSISDYMKEFRPGYIESRMAEF